MRRTVVFTAAVCVAAIVAVAAALFTGLIRPGVPSKDDPAAYTKAFVQQAIDRYERDGREATIAYHNDPNNSDGQWFVFIIGEDGLTIAHISPEVRGRDPALRVDSTGYFFGDDLLAAP